MTGVNHGLPKLGAEADTTNAATRPVGSEDPTSSTYVWYNTATCSRAESLAVCTPGFKPELHH